MIPDFMEKAAFSRQVLAQGRTAQYEEPLSINGGGRVGQMRRFITTVAWSLRHYAKLCLRDAGITSNDATRSSGDLRVFVELVGHSVWTGSFQNADAGGC